MTRVSLVVCASILVCAPAGNWRLSKSPAAEPAVAIPVLRRRLRVTELAGDCLESASTAASMSMYLFSLCAGHGNCFATVRDIICTSNREPEECRDQKTPLTEDEPLFI